MTPQFDWQIAFWVLATIVLGGGVITWVEVSRVPSKLKYQLSEDPAVNEVLIRKWRTGLAQVFWFSFFWVVFCAIAAWRA